MAIERNNANQGQQQSQARRNTERAEPMGYLNLQVKDANGKLHSVKAYIPLEEGNAVHQGIMNKFKTDPKCTFEIQGTIGVKQTEVPTF